MSKEKYVLDSGPDMGGYESWGILTSPGVSP